MIKKIKLRYRTIVKEVEKYLLPLVSVAFFLSVLVVTLGLVQKTHKINVTRADTTLAAGAWKWTAPEPTDDFDCGWPYLEDRELIYLNPEGYLNHNARLQLIDDVFFVNHTHHPYLREDGGSACEPCSGVNIWGWISPTGEEGDWTGPFEIFPPPSEVTNVPYTGNLIHTRDFLKTSDGTIYAIGDVREQIDQEQIAWIARSITTSGDMGPIFFYRILQPDKIDTPYLNYPDWTNADVAKELHDLYYDNTPDTSPLECPWGPEWGTIAPEDGNEVIEWHGQNVGNGLCLGIGRSASYGTWRFYSAESRQDGARYTWSDPIKTEVPNANAASELGQLPDGRLYIMGALAPREARECFAIAIANEGTTFDQVYYLNPDYRLTQYTTSSIIRGDYVWSMTIQGVSNPFISKIPLSALGSPPASTPTPTPTQSNEITINPVADSYVRSDYPSSNFGSSEVLGVDASPVKIAYLKFNLSGVEESEIQSIHLKYRVGTASGADSTSTQYLKVVSDNSWTESSITYNSRPSVPSSYITSIPGGALGEWKELDITSSTKQYAGGYLTLALDSTGSNGLDIFSRESSYDPELYITLSSVAPTNTPTPTPTPVATATPTPTPIPGNNEVVLDPIDDSFVMSSKPDDNYGSSSWLRVDGSPYVTSYFKFDLSEIAGKTVTRATFRYRINTDSGSGSGSIQDFRGVSNTSWSEDSITYTNRPAVGNVVNSITGGSPGEWKEVDLTNWFVGKEGNLVSIAMDSSGEDGLYLYSKEAVLDNRPELVVEYSDTQTSENLIVNPGFEDGTSSWTFYTNASGSFTTTSSSYEGSLAANVSINTAGTNVQFYQKDITLKPNTSYRLEFAAMSNSGHDLDVYLHKHDYPYTNYGLSASFNLESYWKTFWVEFTTTNFSSEVNDGRLRFWLSPYDVAGDLYRIDAISLTEI